MGCEIYEESKGMRWDDGVPRTQHFFLYLVIFSDIA
jgi:hypothetical protein